MWRLLLDSSSAYREGYHFGVVVRPYAGVAVAVLIIVAGID